MLAEIGLAEVVSRAMLRYLPPDSASARINLSFDASPRVLEFTELLSFVVCFLFALVPAIRATSPALASAMKRVRGGWMSRLLIVGQAGMCTLLLIVAGLFVRSLLNLQHLDSGFLAEHVTVADIEFPHGHGPAQRQQRLEALRTQTAALAGVRNAALSHVRPLSGFAISGDIQNQPIFEQHVSPGFFADMGTPLPLDRDFTERDIADSLPVAVVNEAFARQFLPADHVLGRHFGFDIVGMVKDTRWVNLRDKPPPIGTQRFPFPLFALAAPGGQMRGVQPPAAEHGADGALVPTGLDLVEDGALVVGRKLAPFGVGRDLRVGKGLGRGAAGVQWMVLLESLLLLMLGFFFGVPAALVTIRYTASMLFGLTYTDR